MTREPDGRIARVRYVLPRHKAANRVGLSRGRKFTLPRANGVVEISPFECPGCGGDIRLIAFLTEPGPIQRVLTHLGEPLEHPPITPARGPPTDWGGLVHAHDDRAIVQASHDELPAIDIHSL